MSGKIRALSPKEPVDGAVAGAARLLGLRDGRRRAPARFPGPAALSRAHRRSRRQHDRYRYAGFHGGDPMSSTRFHRSLAGAMVVLGCALAPARASAAPSPEQRTAAE